MLIGVDFDNTIVCYDQLFYRVALERGLIPASLVVSKVHVRDYLRACDKENAWNEMQGIVYGARIHEAPAFPGVIEFFEACSGAGIAACIISHKTRHPYAGTKYDLHRAAYEWLERKGFLGSSPTGLQQVRVSLELTKSGKLERIGKAGCTHFIDDLPEFLLERDFPEGVERILFDPNDAYPEEKWLRRARSWGDIQQMVLENIPSRR